MKRTVLLSTSLFAIYPLSNALAHDSGPHESALYFEDGIVTENPFPETELRADYIYQNVPGNNGTSGARESTINLEANYAFNRAFGIYASLPYTFHTTRDGSQDDAHLDNAEVGIKFANFDLEDSGVVIGGGLSVGIPTGDDEVGIGSEETFDITPSIGVGIDLSTFKLTIINAFDFPTDQNSEGKNNMIWEYGLSLQHETSDHFTSIIDINGKTSYGGDDDGFTPVSITPGAKFSFSELPAFQFSAGVSVPVSTNKEFFVSPKLSMYYEF